MEYQNCIWPSCTHLNICSSVPIPSAFFRYWTSSLCPCPYSLTSSVFLPQDLYSLHWVHSVCLCMPTGCFLLGERKEVINLTFLDCIISIPLFIALRFVALHRCYVLYKFKVRPSTSRKIITHFISRLAQFGTEPVVPLRYACSFCSSVL